MFRVTFPATYRPHSVNFQNRHTAVEFARLLAASEGQTLQEVISGTLFEDTIGPEIEAVEYNRIGSSEEVILEEVIRIHY
tara:strand:+ start:53721 stop:53960 length:240 start_codon:yes stop_codon:yes gene_type:complete